MTKPQLKPKSVGPLTKRELGALRSLLAKAEALVNAVPEPAPRERGPERSKHAPAPTPELESFFGRVHSPRQLAGYTQEQLLELLDQRAIRARNGVINAQRELMECGRLIEALQQPDRPNFTRTMDVKKADNELEKVKGHILWQRRSIRQLRYARNKRAGNGQTGDASESFQGTRVQGADYFDDILEEPK
jgi:hypothetical protein